MNKIYINAFKVDSVSDKKKKAEIHEYFIYRVTI